MKYPLLACCLFFFLNQWAFAQNGAILRGEVINDGQTVDFAEVVLLQADNLQLVTHTTVQDGHFTFEAMSLGDYQLRVFALGYLDYQMEVKLSQNQQVNIELQKDAAVELTEVVVKEKRQLFTNEQGNLRMNVAETNLSATPSALDLLSKLPGVILSADRQSVTIIGQGSPLIYLNQQRISLGEYSAIPVSDIQDVSIINNPSARYEASGRVVLLVRLRKQRAEGYRIELSETLTSKEGFNNYLIANANWNRHKLTGKANIGYEQLQPWEQVLSDFVVPAQALASNYKATVFGPRGVYCLGGGLSYTARAGQSFSCNFSGRIRDGRGDIVTTSQLLTNNQSSNILTLSDQGDERIYANASANYSQEWEKTSLFLAGQYLYYERNSDTDLENSFDAGPLIPTQTRDQLFLLQRYATRADLEHTFSDQLRGELGLNLSWSVAPTTQKVTDFTSTPPLIVNSVFSLDERLLAAYNQWSGQLGTLEWGMGLRAEQADTKGLDGQSTAPLLQRDQLRLFPNASLSIPLDTNRTLSLNYRRSISRPAFSRLNQVAFYVNPFTIIQENPSLQASLADQYALVLQQGQRSLRLSYTDREAPAVFTTLYDEDRELYVLTRRNFERSRSLMLTLSLPWQYKLWSSINSVSIVRNKITDEVGLLGAIRPYVHVYTNQTLRFSEQFSVSLRAWGMSQRQEGIFERNALITADLVVSLRVKEKWRFTFAFNDIFNGIHYEDRASIQGIESIQRFNVDSRELSLSIAYTLGESQSNFRTREVMEDANRAN